MRPSGRTDPITDARGRPLPGSIAAIESIELGGVTQSLLVRGRSTDNPVLLFLHGGPGTSELGILRRYNVPALEPHFTVVIWDQRGAAKSFSAIEPRSAMTVEQLVADTLELSALLCRRFAKDKIFLAGHSWGSALGALSVAREPARFHAFVGIGQVADMLEGERLSYRFTLERATQAGDRRAVAKLRSLGEPPWSPPIRPKLLAQRALLARYGGEVHGDRHGGALIVLRALLCSEYGLRDRWNFFRGALASMDLLWEELLTIDLFAQAPALDVPVYFLEGRHDYEAPSSVAARYFDALRAPRKELVWFERSAHFINVEEAEAFNRFFTERLRAEVLGEGPLPVTAPPR